MNVLFNNNLLGLDLVASGDAQEVNALVQFIDSDDGLVGSIAVDDNLSEAVDELILVVVGLDWIRKDGETKR